MKGQRRISRSKNYNTVDVNSLKNIHRIKQAGSVWNLHLYNCLSRGRISTIKSWPIPIL